MTTIHLVYAGTPNSGSIQAPYTITDNLYNSLSKIAPVRYYQWSDTTIIDENPDDIVIGHPHYNPETVIQQAFNKKFKAKILIHPLHTKRANDNYPFNHLAIKADKILAIAGPYWIDTIHNTPFAHWKPKITRLDLAVDHNTYPYLKHTFNPPGSRSLLYIGSDSPNKNLPYLHTIMKNLPDVKLHWYGGHSNHPLAKLPNVHTTGWVTLNHQTATTICQQTDIMVSVSDSDANPTTLLETTAWGLIPACTKESGYYNDPMFTELHLDNITQTLNTLRNLLTEPNHILEHRSRQSRQKIIEHYNWHNFTTKVINTIKEYL